MPSSPKTILVTRPQPEADRMIVRLETKGLKAVAAPLVTIEYPACPALEYHKIQALIATSKNGLRALVKSQYHKCFFDLPLFAVGSATAIFAKTQGFTQIYEGTGVASDLTKLVAKHVHKDKGPLFHLAGSVLAFDLKSLLEAEGFEIIAPVLYHASAIKSLPAKISSQLALRQIGSVTLLSPRMSKIFLSLLETENLSGTMNELDFYCLSEKVAQPLRDYSLANEANSQKLKIHIAQEPSLESLLNSIRIPTI